MIRLLVKVTNSSCEWALRPAVIQRKVRLLRFLVG
jgi:hypothetical protein